MTSLKTEPLNTLILLYGYFAVDDIRSMISENMERFFIGIFHCTG
ncbi:hypothetical protein [uncultured Shewanella sp.]|nr:hypothetical protein [uncultured Shewanella sp.]